MIASEEDTRKHKRCSCCFPIICACCALQTTISAILLVTIVLLVNFFISSETRNSNHNLRNSKTYEYLRLPNDTKPVHYDLTLLPYLENGTFHGAVNITLTTEKSEHVLVLHSNNLTVQSAKLLKGTNESVIKIDKVERIDEEEVILIHLSQWIDPGTYQLCLHFSGNMMSKLHGLYVSRYKNQYNEMRTIATSKFEPTYARQAFPCFDEPNMKATYTVHLWKPKDPSYIALSNYPQVNETDYQEGILVHFEETVSMSTYLTCFIVSDFNYIETSFDNKGEDIPFRVYASPGQLNKTEYAGTVGKKIIEYYIDYFNIPYPLPKLDMVAIPDFSSGAMEHWGLVTYRETALLYTPETHSTENKQRVLVVVAHELAHSWFGNLVTMDWWDNLWLNEGFASYIEYKGGDAAEPSFGLMDQFLVRELHPVLNFDAKLSSHPIIQEVTNPDQINEVFDTISYNKGASVLRMLEHAVGEDNFKKGITNYLMKYKYGNAVTKHLWSEIQEIVGSSIDVADFMGTFTIQMGYPILNVTIDGNTYIIRQKRFLTNPDDAEKDNSSPLGYKWTIPLTYVTDRGISSEVTWFNKTEDFVVIEKPKNAKWMKFNPQQAGYFRVNYPETMWKDLTDNILNLSITDRTHLLEETFSIAYSGQLSYELPLQLTKYLKNESNYAPWEVASTKMKPLLKLMVSSPYEMQFKEYLVSILKPIYNNVSWKIGDQDDHLTKLVRTIVLKFACEVEYESALNEASNQLDRWFSVRNAMPDVREIVYKYGMKNANQEKWDKMFNIFTEENDANEKLKLLQGLAAVSDPSLLSRMLELARDEKYIRNQDYYHFISMLSRNPIGLPIVWDFVRNNWEYLVNRFTLNDRYLGEMIPTITSSFSTNIKLAEMESFFAANPEAGAGTAARKRALENVKNNIAWLKKHSETVGKWIVKNIP